MQFGTGTAVYVYPDGYLIIIYLVVQGGHQHVVSYPVRPLPPYPLDGAIFDNLGIFDVVTSSIISSQCSMTNATEFSNSLAQAEVLESISPITLIVVFLLMTPLAKEGN